MKKRTVKPPLGWEMTTVSSLMDELKKSNNIGKKALDSCLVEYKGETWELRKIKG